jgi:Mrp family chromosome partitioning ATPase
MSDHPAPAPLETIPIVETLPVFEERGTEPASPAGVVEAILDPRSSAGGQLSLLATRLRALARDKRLRRVGVVSANRGEGRTAVALGLARALAEGDPQERVLLLELDVVRPAADRVLGLAPPEVGLCRFLEGRGDVPELRRPVGEGFWLLSAGAAGGETTALLSSHRTGALLKAIDRVFDFVVADCPPVLGPDGLGRVPDLLDGYVFVVRARHSPRETVRQAATSLRPERITGLVLNAHHDILPRTPLPRPAS